MNYNPMSGNDYDAIRWLEEKSNDPNSEALKNAWIVLKKYYDECKEELRNIDTSTSPFQDNSEKINIFSKVKEIIYNPLFILEVKDFFNQQELNEETILNIINKQNHTLEEEWLIAKIMRLYNMHLKLGHSARITYVAEHGLQNLPETPNNLLLKRTVLLSALLHDIGRFYEATHYNSFGTMQAKEKKINSIENGKVREKQLLVDHAIAGYYYSLASALELHKLLNVNEDEEKIRYITEAIAAIVVRYHQVANGLIAHFDYQGPNDPLSSIDYQQLVESLYQFINDSYDQAILMDYGVDSKMNPNHKAFIDNFIQKIESFFLEKDPSITDTDWSLYDDGFEYDKNEPLSFYNEIKKGIKNIFENMHGMDIGAISTKIVNFLNDLLLRLTKEGFTSEEKDSLKMEIENHLKGMLNYDIAASINDTFINKSEVNAAVHYLISAALNMTMDADKIDILNQRALGIYNTSYKIATLSIFPTENTSLLEIIEEYFKYDFQKTGEFFVIDNKILRILNSMKKQQGNDVYQMLQTKIGNFLDLKLPENTPIFVYRDRIIIGKNEYPNAELYNIFTTNWIQYLKSNMNLQGDTFKEFKENNYGLLQLTISREDFEDNIKDYPEEQKIEFFKNLLVTDGLRERFMTKSKNRPLKGWILDIENEDSDHLVHGSVSGLLWQLNQFIMVNMRNKKSLEFIRDYNLLDQIYYQYLEKDPIVAEIIKEHIEYVKNFINQTIELIETDSLTDEILTSMRQNLYNSFVSNNNLSKRNV